MYYALVPKSNRYRGVERTMNPEDIFPQKKYNNQDMELYFKYIEDTDLSIPTLDTLKEYKVQFETYHANCEIIIYGDRPLQEPENSDYVFLGIDIVNDHESFLAESGDYTPEIKKLLNSNGLCDTLEVEEKVQQILYEKYHMPLEPCWVYLCSY